MTMIKRSRQESNRALAQVRMCSGKESWEREGGGGGVQATLVPVRFCSRLCSRVSYFILITSLLPASLKGAFAGRAVEDLDVPL